MNSLRKTASKSKISKIEAPVPPTLPRGIGTDIPLDAFSRQQHLTEHSEREHRVI
jgi:hypothetical protein